MKKNIKMRVTPEQSVKVQEICFENGIDWDGTGKFYHLNEPFIYIYELSISYDNKESIRYFRNHENKEIDADLFIRTSGTCEEDTFNELFEKVSERVNEHQLREETYKPYQCRCVMTPITDKVIESVAKVNGWDKLENSHYTMNMLLDKLKKKNEILKKARIKRKNQREELHKLNLKLQKCISFEEHNQIIEKLKAVIEYLESKAK